MSSSTTFVGRITLLNGENYSTWKVQMEGILHKLRLLPYVNGKITRSTNATEAQSWDEKDMDAKSELLLALEPSQVLLVKSLQTSKEIWNFLEETYDRKGTRQKAEEFRKLINMKMNGTQNMNDYICQFFASVTRIKELGAQIDDELLVVMLLDSLPEHYKEIQAAFDAASSYPDLNTVKTRLLEVGEKKKDVLDNAFKIQKVRNPVNNTSKTFNKSSKHEFFPFNCRKCGRKGHKAKNCRIKNGETSNLVNKDEKGFMLQENLSVLEIANNVLVANNIVEKQNLRTWYLDSGATSHMCCCKSLFSTLKFGEYGKVQLANNQSSKIEGIGTVKIETKVNDNIECINLYNTLFVPELRSNLISLSKATDNGCEVILKDNKALIKSKNKKLIE